MCKARAKKRGLTISFHQSNSEAQIIDWIHGGINRADGIIINPAAFTHTSVAILDALNMVEAADHRAAHFQSAQARAVPPSLLRDIRRDRADLRARCRRLSACGRRDGGPAGSAKVMTAFEHILTERDGAILWITINRPAALNSLNPQAHRELSAALDGYAADASVARCGHHRHGRARVLRRQRPQGALDPQCRRPSRRPASAASRIASIWQSP